MAHPKLRRLIAATASLAASLAFAVPTTALYWRVSHHSWLLDVPLHGFGVICMLIGYIAWIRLPESRVGLIIMCLGIAYYLQDLRASSNVVIFNVGFSLSFVWAAVVAHLVLAWPTGRVAGRGSQALLVCCYVAAVTTQALRLVVDHWRPPVAYDTPYTPTPASVSGSISVIVLALAVVVVTVRRWLAASDLRRRWTAPVWTAVLLLAIPSTAASIASIVHAPVRVENALLLATLGTAVLLVPVVRIAQSANAKRARWRLARVVLDPEHANDLKLHPELLQRVLADALGDPSLRVAYPIGDSRYVDVEGQPILPALGGAGRAITTVEHAGEPIAMIEHDEAVNEQHQVATTAAEVAGVAIEIARMHASLRAQIEQIKTSRLRISEAALEERRRIEHDLHDGAQQQFLAVLALLGLARSQLDADQQAITPAQGFVHRAHGQLQDAINALRELARGIYPTALTEHGLAAAVEGIADTSLVPIGVDIPRTRWPRQVETAAYFLIAEAIANANRHAEATQIEVRVHELDEHILVEVSDDGQGGAKTEPRSMLDRVNTIGGSLTVNSEPGKGTTILAKLPLERSRS